MREVFGKPSTPPLVFLLLLSLTACNPGRSGGGGVSVGTSLTQVYFSLEPVRVILAPSSAFLFPEKSTHFYESLLSPLPLQTFLGTITTVVLGIAEIRLRYGLRCLEPEIGEMKARGPFMFSLTDAVIKPEIPPLPITRSTTLCEIRLKGNKGSLDRPEEGPPFLIIRGALEDGRGLLIVSDEDVDFKIRWNPISLTATVQEIRLHFPYPMWLAELRASQFSEPTLVVINTHTHKDILERILDSIENTAEGKEGRRCDPSLPQTIGKRPEELCPNEEED